jgi:transcriptional regulator with XRE-family HTH domain
LAALGTNQDDLELTSSFGAALRTHRVAAGLTQEDLAEQSGLSVRAIRNLEIGRTARPQRQTVSLLATALDLGDTARTALFRSAQRSRRVHGVLGIVPTPRTEPRADPVLSGRCELPVDVPFLIGRERIADEMCAFLDDPVGHSGHARPVRLVTVTGPPGAGRTALAVHVAHRLRDRFPDGQLYVDLQGAQPEPMPLPAILGRVLRSMGVTALPEGTEERAALLRATLTEHRILLILDNAADEGQIRPLLATSARGAVLVTSRRRLPALHGGHSVTLGALDTVDSVAVLAGIAGPDRVAAEPQAARAIAQFCGGLPLAVHIAGVWLAARPQRHLREFANLLADEQHRLDHLRIGDLAMANSIAAYCDQLAPPVRRALDLLAVARLPEFDARLVAGLLGVSIFDGQEIIEDLAHGQLITPCGPGRDAGYRLHQLVRLYAHGNPSIDQQNQRWPALRRVLRPADQALAS